MKAFLRDPGVLFPLLFIVIGLGLAFFAAPGLSTFGFGVAECTIMFGVVWFLLTAGFSPVLLVCSAVLSTLLTFGDVLNKRIETTGGDVALVLAQDLVPIEGLSLVLIGSVFLAVTVRAKLLAQKAAASSVID